jgi:hypothetical protein
MSQPLTTERTHPSCPRILSRAAVLPVRSFGFAEPCKILAKALLCLRNSKARDDRPQNAAA